MHTDVGLLLDVIDGMVEHIEVASREHRDREVILMCRGILGLIEIYGLQQVLPTIFAETTVTLRGTLQ